MEKQYLDELTAVIGCLAHAATRTRQAQEDIEIGISLKRGVDVPSCNCCTNRYAPIARSAASSCRPKLPTMSNGMVVNVNRGAAAAEKC
jgi:hypothetical protein